MESIDKWILKCKLSGIGVDVENVSDTFILKRVKTNGVCERFELPEFISIVMPDCFNLCRIDSVIFNTQNLTIRPSAFKNSRIRHVKCNKVSIGSFAFSGCKYLESFEHKGVEKFSENCFSYSNLRYFDFDGCDDVVINSCAFAWCEYLEELRNLNKLRSIYLNDSCFTNCSSLKELYFPDNTVLCRNCFSGCFGLRKVVLKDFTISTGYKEFIMGLNDIFHNHDDDLKVYVPTKYANDIKVNGFFGAIIKGYDNGKCINEYSV